MCGSVECMDALIKAGANPNSKTLPNITPAHLIAQNGCLMALEKLQEWNMDMNSVDKYGRPPINYAINNGQMEMVNELQKLGCKPVITVGQLYAAFGGKKLSAVKNLDNLMLHDAK